MAHRVNGIRVHKRNNRGNFIFRLPQLSRRMFYIDKSKRIVSLADTRISARALAKDWGVTKDKVLAWRALVRKLVQERPTLFTGVLHDYSVARKIRKQYYYKGGNYLRHEYGLSGAATRGLLTLLTILGEIDVSANERQIAVEFAQRMREGLKTNEFAARLRRDWLKEKGIIRD